MPKVKQEMFENTPIRQYGEKNSAPGVRKLFRETREEGKWEAHTENGSGWASRIELRNYSTQRMRVDRV
jgi:hypothetical protein